MVEVDAKIASFIVKGLKQEGYGVDHAPDGDTGLALTASTTYDAAVVDVMLPGLDGLSLVKRLRASRTELPVLFLSARSSVQDRIAGLQAGGPLGAETHTKWGSVGACYLAPNTFFKIALPVPTGSWRIFFSSSPMMR